MSGWLYVAASILYTVGAAYDLFTAMVVTISLRWVTTARRGKKRREVVEQLSSLGAVGHAAQVHQNTGVLRATPMETTTTMMPGEQDPQAMISPARKLRNEDFGREAHLALLSTLLAATYFFTCLFGFIGGSCLMTFKHPSNLEAAGSNWVFIAACSIFVLLCGMDMLLLSIKKKSSSNLETAMHVKAILFSASGCGLWVVGCLLSQPDIIPGNIDPDVAPTLFCVGSVLFITCAGWSMVHFIHRWRSSAQQMAPVKPSAENRAHDFVVGVDLESSFVQIPGTLRTRRSSNIVKLVVGILVPTDEEEEEEEESEWDNQGSVSPESSRPSYVAVV